MNKKSHSMSILFINYDMIIIWYIYVLVECIAHVFWDMSILTGLQLMTYIRVVGTKGKHISDIWVGMQVWLVSGRWEWITWPCTHIPHTLCFITFRFMTVFIHVLSFILLILSLWIMVCKYSFEDVCFNISLVDYDLPATVF